jgi:hypothetical protein
LGHTTRQGGAFDYKPAIFRFVERHMKNHVDILPIASGCHNAGCFHCDLACTGVSVLLT